MKTDDLIAALAADVPPVRPHAVGSRLALGLLAGGVLSLIVTVLWLGVRPDMMDAMYTGSFWMKFAYAFATAAFGFGLVDRLARPGEGGGVFGPLILVPLLVMVVLAIFQYVEAPQDQRMPLVMGSSARVCTRMIVLLSLPVFAGLMWSLRALAPTRLTLAGAAAGALAGAAGTIVYEMHCTESAAPFVAIWYTLGIAAMALLGALLGRILLRWA